MCNWKIVPIFFIGVLTLCTPATAQRLLPDTRWADTLSGQIRVAGSDTMAPLVSAIAKRFQALHPAVHIEIQTGGSGRGIADVVQGKADIGMASRALKDTEGGLVGFSIARDGVAVVVHKDNPIRALTDQKIADIFAGKINNWNSMGGRDAPILVVMSEPGGGSYELFTNYFGIRGADVKIQRVLGNNPARLSLMAENPNAILYMSVSEAARNVQANASIKLLPIANVVASSKNIRDGNYPLSRPLTLVTQSAPRGLIKVFIEYALSSQVTDLVLAHDFVPYLD